MNWYVIYEEKETKYYRIVRFRGNLAAVCMVSLKVFAIVKMRKPAQALCNILNANRFGADYDICIGDETFFYTDDSIIPVFKHKTKEKGKQPCQS